MQEEMIYLSDGDVVVRSCKVTDAMVIAHYYQENRQFLTPWEPERDEEFYTSNGWLRRLLKLREVQSMRLGYFLLILDRVSDKMLGTISFSQVSRFPIHACNVGYSLDQTAQGRGIMTTALKLAVDYMFDSQNMHRVSAAYMPHNERSAAVLRRLGFVVEGEAKAYLLIDGEWRDHILTAKINSNWRESAI